MNTPNPLDLLKLDLEVALELAADGRALEGYRVLDGGLAAIEAPPVEPWSEDLIHRYREAMVLYAQAHGLWFNLPPDADDLCPPSRCELVQRSLEAVSETRARLAEKKVATAQTRAQARQAREQSRRAREESAHVRSRWPAARLKALVHLTR